MYAEQIVVLLLVAAGAGWVDAVVGGGGLLQIPALLLANPGAPVAHALGTNKLSSIAGTSTAAVTYARRTKLDRRLLAPAAALAVGSAGMGAAAAAAISSHVFRPVVMVLLVVVAAFVAFRPCFGRVQRGGTPTRARLGVAVVLAGGLIAFYDGVFGPGTGTFLIICFTTLLGLDFVHSSATAKFVNVGTNLGALVVFALAGHVMWLLGLAMAGFNVAGARLGTRMALTHGTEFIRMVLLVVVVAVVIKLGADQWMGR